MRRRFGNILAFGGVRSKPQAALFAGGPTTQIGISPNIVVSRAREELTGESFSMFDFMPAGAILAAAGVVFPVWPLV